MSTQVYKRVYGSVEEMIAFADEGYQAGRRYDFIDNNDSYFVGRSLNGWADVKVKFAESWQEGLDEVQWMLHELRGVTLPPIKCRKRKARFADDGDEVDHDRLRSGQEYWRTVRRESADGPRTFTIVTDMGTLGEVAARDVLWRGAIAIAIADLLEQQGNRVELWAAGHQTRTYADRAGSFQAVCLKRTDQPVDISTLTNLVSGWSYRTLFFQQRAAEPLVHCVGMGSSYPIQAGEEDIQALAGTSKPIVISNIWSRDAAVAFARNLLETINQE